MAYGKIKADTLVYDNSGSDVEKTIASLAASAPTASPTFTGTPAAPTAAANTNNTQIATTEFVHTNYATKDSPTFVGTPAAPTAAANTNNTQIATTAYVDGSFAPLAAPALTGNATAVNLTLSGNLTVNGSTTTVSSSTLEVADKNIELGKVSTPTDTTADGGGITLKGATDKTITWVDATDSWDFNQNIKITNASDASTLKFYRSDSLSDNDVVADLFFVGKQSDGTDKTYGYIRTTALDETAGTVDSKITFVTKTAGSDKTIDFQDGGATFTGTVSDSKGDVRKIPQVSVSSAYTLIASNAGKHVIISSGGVTVPNNVLSTGDAVTIINNSGSDQTITQASGLTLYNTADGSTGNRTLAGRGMCTVLIADGGASSYAYISGAGLS